MARRTQRWIPDTCSAPGCSFIEAWDDETDSVSRTHTFVTRERVCTLHASLDPAASYTQAIEENRRKNVVWTAALELNASLIHSSFDWDYSESGLLKVSFGDGLTDLQRSNLQDICDIQFGPGKVAVS